MAHPSDLAGRRVLVVGLARQGTALVRFLVAEGAHVTVTDLRPAEALASPLRSLAGLPVRYALGGHPLTLLDEVDMVCVSGGVPADSPLVTDARRRGIDVSNDAQLTLERSPAPIIGVTGSAGKTTITTLTGLILEAAGIRVHVGGNIGTPLIDRLGELQPDGWAVMELSSFQLELCDRSPAIAAVTNVTPNHIDRHGTMTAYTAAKANILRWQMPEDSCVLNADDAIAGEWLRSGTVDLVDQDTSHTLGFPLLAQRLGYSLSETLPVGAYLRNDSLHLHLPGQPETTICHRAKVRLRGMHNLANLLAACLLAGLAGASPEATAEVAASFGGVEHRLETVRALGGVLWVNDSIATTPERSAAALRSFDEPIILLAGGRDKNLSWDDWAALVRKKVKHLVLFGEASDIAEAAVRRTMAANGEPGSSGCDAAPHTVRCLSLEEAVAAAQQCAEPGDVVVLAPGGTSFDAYDDFAARGEHFRSLVRALQE